MTTDDRASRAGEARRTLFVRNLPYTTTDDRLTSAFAKYGAIKSCFTVKDKGVIDRCKGYGYVLFEKREDAERARSGVKKIEGRVVQIVFADKRPLKNVRNQREKKQSETADDELLDDIESESEDSGDSDYEALTAREAVSATAATPTKHRKPKSDRREARYDVGRVVVVTGIPLSLHKSKLRKKCSKYGPLEDFVCPVAADEDGEEAVNGLKAHVTYKKHINARKAIKGLKGLSFGDAVNPLSAVLMSKEGKAVSKGTLAKARLIIRNISFDVSSEDLMEAFSRHGNVREVHIPRKPNGQMRGFAFVQFTSYFDAASALEGLNGSQLKGRPVAVDWVVPKSHYEASLHNIAASMVTGTSDNDKTCDGGESELGAGCEGGGVEEGWSENGDELSSGGEEEEEEEGEEEEGQGEGEEEEGQGEGEEEEGQGEGEEESKAKPFKADVHKGMTVFLRNLPLGSSEIELKELFSQFGRVRYARIVLDKETGLSRGTAFVQFIQPASLQRCLEASDNQKERKELLYNGRQLDVCLALSPRELVEMKEKGTLTKTDKRNLCLSQEGNVRPGSEATEGLTKSELAKRLKAQAEKKAKLANPNFYVSRTRLSVRNLPTQTNESELKAIFNSAINSGKITQLKILRSKDRVDSEGVGRSKGFAFVEFSTHDAALAALRAINNNPNIFPSKKRLIVEFAVEDARIMRAREQRKKRSESKKGVIGGQILEHREEGHKGVRGKGVRGTNKRVEWQLKCKEKRLRRRERRGGHSDNGDEQNRNVKKINRGGGIGRKRRDPSDVPSVESVAGAGDDVKRRKRSDVSVDGVRKHQKIKPSKRQSRRARRGGVEQREEAAFSDMLDTYRKKLSTLQH